MTNQPLPQEAAGSTHVERGNLSVGPNKANQPETEPRAVAAIAALPELPDEGAERSYVEHWGINE